MGAGLALPVLPMCVCVRCEGVHPVPITLHTQLPARQAQQGQLEPAAGHPGCVPHSHRYSLGEAKAGEVDVVLDEDGEL